MNKNRKERERAVKKVERAIDALVDLQDLGFGSGDVQRILDALNSLRARLEQSS